MKTEKELNEAILKITMAIRDNYPELSKYLNEMPVTIPISENPEINLKNLQDYFNSLDTLFRKYVINHNIKLL
ncbi:hypothetical protein [Flavobacterium sp.]|uniref:hypothetical protein n=1 Tax=Flavobacterium sp. TaxID=239 RepID=UPI00286C0876|nr:hypothetical protein [Flavobacterium sp.]